MQADEKEKTIGNDTFYRIVSKEPLPGAIGKVEIIVPTAACRGNDREKVVDENGHCFHLKGPAMLSFRGKIPQWYRETFLYLVDDTLNENEIGDYIRFV